MPEGQSYRKKLIEVALPLEDINRESAREKSIRHGHPSTLHLWWARRPLAACRAVLFAQMVDDPSSLPEDFPTEAAQGSERERLFDIIRDLVRWENTTNEAVLHRARVEIARSAARNHGVSLLREMTPAEVADALKRYAPPVLDPFAGGGSIPLEAQRLGLEAHASDLNPVAVLINKALIEIPPKFAGRPPVNPESRKRYLQKEWKGAEGLAEDVRYYGKWMRDEAFKRIGHLYPKVRLPKEQGGGEATVIAWLWARTVTCPNPACGARMPLVRSYALSTKKGKETWVEPLVDHSTTPPTIAFTTRKRTSDHPMPVSALLGSGLVNDKGKKVQATFKCCACQVGIANGEYVDIEADEGRMGVMPLAVVVESKGGRQYLPFDTDQAAAVRAAQEFAELPELRKRMPGEPARGTFASNAQGRIYGFKTFRDYFAPRQLVALTTFCGLVGEARAQALRETGGDAAYAADVATYLALAVDRLVDRCSSICSWDAGYVKVRNTFGRQAIPMTWDYAEANPFSESTGNFGGATEWIVEVLDAIVPGPRGTAEQVDATVAVNGVAQSLISTDPPYYDNISYADLSDFFYVWLRRSLSDMYPGLFGTLLVPKTAELIATPYRFGGSAEKARQFFEAGSGEAFTRMHEAENVHFPLTVYYAFKQAESDGTDDSDVKSGRNGTGASASTGWETMLEGLLRAGFAVSGTWPMRSELSNRMIASGTNALASSIVLVCRPRPADARPATRKDFLNALKRELPTALKELQRGNIAPVDLAQAAIGPGMAVFSRYSNVIEADGRAMRVRTALQLINQALDEVLAEQEGEFDADTRFAVTWFEQYGMGQGKFGVADVLARAKDTSVSGLDEADVVKSHGGNVRLLRRDELPDAWNPHHDHRLSVWKVTQHLIHAVMEGGGTQAAAAVLDAVGSDYGEKARDLAYRLYVTSERKKWTQDAFAYNTLVTEWHDISGGAEGIRQRERERERETVRQATLIEE